MHACLHPYRVPAAQLVLEICAGAREADGEPGSQPCSWAPIDLSNTETMQVSGGTNEHDEGNIRTLPAPAPAPAHLGVVDCPQWGTRSVCLTGLQFCGRLCLRLSILSFHYCSPTMSSSHTSVQ